MPKSVEGSGAGVDPGDFEEAIGVEKIDDNTWIGKHPLRLPISGARGVYGGHTCAQTLLVAIESAPGFIPHLFHSHFIRAGSPKHRCVFKVTALHDGKSYSQRQIHVYQEDKVMYTAICSLVKIGTKVTLGNLNVMHKPPKINQKYPNPDDEHIVVHTDFIKNSYPDELVDYRLSPEEDNIPPAERWITVWSKLYQPNKSEVDDKRFNYVGLADLSDLALLTTMARALHIGWNPTVDNPFESFDEGKDAREIMKVSLNALHIYHYIAMSLSHHIYFHTDNYDSFNVIGDWLTLTYQFKISRNHRTLVRGFFYNKEGNCVATVIQEGLTYFRPGVPGDVRL